MGAWKTVALMTLALMAVAQPAEGAKRKAPSCAKADSATVRTSEQVRVYRVLEDAGNEVVHDRLVACLRQTGRRTTVALGYSSSGYDQTYANVRLNGPRVALSVRRSSDACKYGCTDVSLAGSGSVEVFDVRRGRRVRRSPIPFPGFVGDVALTAGGSVAWLVGDRVQAADQAGLRTLDSGVAPSAVDAEGSIISWVRDGAERFARLADGPVTPAAKRKARRSCAMKGSKTVAADRDARLFTAGVRYGGQVVAIKLYGCLRSSGRRIALAVESIDDVYEESSSFAAVRLAGRFAAWHEVSSDYSCKAACPPGYEASRGQVRVFDLGRRRGVRAVPTREFGNALALTGRGGVAWLDANRLVAADRAGARTLDTGAISGPSLRAETTIVSWGRDGSERFARLAPAR